MTIEARTNELTVFWDRFFDRQTVRQSGHAGSVFVHLTDDEVIYRALSARNAEKFSRLFERGDTGDYDGDDSRADQALVSLLAFWTQDPGQLDRLFRRSALYRDKWERSDYRERTIGKAIANRDVYRRLTRIVRAVAPGSARRVSGACTLAEIDYSIDDDGDITFPASGHGYRVRRQSRGRPAVTLTHDGSSSCD